MFFAKEIEMQFISKMMNRAGIAATTLAVTAGPALAGTSGTDFPGLYNLVKGW